MMFVMFSSRIFCVRERTGREKRGANQRSTEKPFHSRAPSWQRL
jgi:hypothetical protein